MSSPTPAPRPVLALDTASPLVSVALAVTDRVLAQRRAEQLHSSATLLQLVDAVLDEAGATLDELEGVAVLRGPGSFTGLRVGLATILGFRQALSLPATAPSTLEVLAVAAAGVESWLHPSGGDPVGECPSWTAAVDALRDEWFVQTWRRASPGCSPQPEAAPRRLRVAELETLAPTTLVGFSVEGLAGRLPADVRLLEPPPLAPILARLAAGGHWRWDDSTLTRPLYLRGPAVDRT